MKQFKVSFIIEVDDNWSETDIRVVTDEAMDSMYHLGDTSIRELDVKEIENLKLENETKQKNLFASICHLADKSNEVETISGEKYKEIVLRIMPKNIEEIRSWIEDEDI